MLLSDLGGQRASHQSRGDAGNPESTPNSLVNGVDSQLIADCRSLVSQFGALLSDIEHAANDKGDEQSVRQAALCDADEQVFDLMGRIMLTRASTHCGVQSKHALADFLLSLNWQDDPSPFRDRLLLSYVLDAARLRYPTASDGHVFADCDLNTETVVIEQANSCLRLIRELSAAFAQKDQNSLAGQADQPALDASIIACEDQKEAAIKALIGIRAGTVSALNAKRLVLRRLLEAGIGSCEAHHLRVELARSYFGDLNCFLKAHAQDHEPLSASHAIWNSLSSSFRWLTSTVQFR